MVIFGKSYFATLSLSDFVCSSVEMEDKSLPVFSAVGLEKSLKIDPNNKYVDYQKHLDCILETKLYWALLRCLEYEPEDRYYLYI